MRAYDVIETTKQRERLSRSQLEWFIRGYTKGEIPDYQMTAWLMAVRLNGLSEQETAYLTDVMAHSGDVVDLSAIAGIKVDKHSTGGVGDKTTLICAPVVAALGVPVAKMSGRALGHTGGTLDKLESIAGFQVELSAQQFIDNVNRHQLAVVGQTGDIAPADKKIYELRDVTATVDSLPLIASSIMSKKLASGSDAIYLDVKVGSGALMKTEGKAIQLAQCMVAIGGHSGKKTAALVSSMDQPLGHAVGNALEVAEAVRTLRGEGPGDLARLSLELAAGMLWLAGRGGLQDCRLLAEKSLLSGDAYRAFSDMVERQGGDVRMIEDPSLLPQATHEQDVLAEKEGHVTHMDTQLIGQVSSLLGAGRATKDDTPDYGAGLIIHAKLGDKVLAGDSLAKLYTSQKSVIPQAEQMLKKAYRLSDVRVAAPPLLRARVTADGVERLQ